MDLARLYAAAGQSDAARNLAQNIINADPDAKADMQALIDSLGKPASPIPTATTTGPAKK